MKEIVAVCISEKKGTEKTIVDIGNLIENHGLENDAHAGDWHRQISLLEVEKIEAFNLKGGDVNYGDFGENIITRGLDIASLSIGDKIQIGEAVLELTQKGKECHHHCKIYYRVGDCIMPREGVFAKVLIGGKIQAGSKINVI